MKKVAGGRLGLSRMISGFSQVLVIPSAARHLLLDGVGTKADFSVRLE
jgi:hypothetical protein